MTSPFAYRNPDGSIDLERALGPALQRYVGIMVAGAAGFGVTAPPEPEDRDSARLVQYGYGQPSRASSSGTLARRPEWSWDVCAYYLVLGVHWRASRGEIRRAYVAACGRPGGQHQDEQLTYVTSQLLDEDVRRAYDLTGLGEVFMGDRDIQAMIRRAAVRESVRRRTEDGEEFTTEEVLEEMGVYQVPPEPEDDAPQDAPQEPAETPPSRWASQWGHYAVAGPQGAPRPDPELLERWQGLVAAALRERGIAVRFAVAQGAEGSPLVLRNINEPCIFVMTEKRISPQQAESAVEMGISLGIVTDTKKEAFSARFRR